jgi:hypothetical protein
MNILIANENKKENDNLINYSKCADMKEHSENTLTTNCSTFEPNRQDLYSDKKQNKVNCNKLNEKSISEDDLKKNFKNVTDYSDDILQNLIEEEKNKNNINSNYFNYQSEITPNMRSTLIDWLIDINGIFKFKEETLYISIYIIDAYLSKKNFSKNKFQLLGVTSLFIASKLNEIILRRISDYSDATDKTYSIQDIQIMEIEILKTLNFELLVPSPLSFYEIITQKVGIVDDINKYKFGEFLIESFLINNQSLNYTPSNIALAACYIIMKFCKMQNYRIIFDNKFFNDKSDYIKEYIIKDCAQKMCEAIHVIINSNLKSINNKFSDNFFYNILKNNM